MPEALSSLPFCQWGPSTISVELCNPVAWCLRHYCGASKVKALDTRLENLSSRNPHGGKRELAPVRCSDLLVHTKGKIKNNCFIVAVYFFICFVWGVLLGAEPRALYMLSKLFTMELHPQMTVTLNLWPLCLGLQMLGLQACTPMPGFTVLFIASRRLWEIELFILCHQWQKKNPY